MNTKNIVIIPARGGSKRMPKKNIKLLGGIPLIAHSILYAKKHHFVDEIYVSTDDEQIKEIAIQYGVIVVNRPKDLSGDFEPTVSALKHVLQILDEKYANVILLQATNPFRPENLLNEAYESFINKKRNSLFTVSQNHHKFGKIIADQFIPFNYTIGQRSQDLDPLFYENGLLYITKSCSILQDEIITSDAIPYKVEHPFAAVDIDTQDDFDYAEYLLNKMNL